MFSSHVVVLFLESVALSQSYTLSVSSRLYISCDDVLNSAGPQKATENLIVRYVADLSFSQSQPGKLAMGEGIRRGD